MKQQMGICFVDNAHSVAACSTCTHKQRLWVWSGASSGLHHDFHDNLYILLRGRKRFRLYPPSEAPHMYTHGQLKKLYPNGRIVYAGQVGCPVIHKLKTTACSRHVQGI